MKKCAALRLRCKSKALLAWVISLLLVFTCWSINPASAVADTQTQAAWADWTLNPRQNKVTGFITTQDSHTVGVTVTASSPFEFVQTDGTGGTDINYWKPSEPYISSVVPSAPPNSDIIALNAKGEVTIEFSEPVYGPFLGLVSWNGNTVDFGVPIAPLSDGKGYWGEGEYKLNFDGTGFQGEGELHGVFLLEDTYRSISFSHTSEDWHGFTIGILGLPSKAGEPCGDPEHSVEGPGFNPENVCASYPPPQSEPITNLATQDPDKQAWEIFADLNQPIGQNPQEPGFPRWRHWPEQAMVYPANPDPQNPPKWSEISESKSVVKAHPPIQKMLRLRENPIEFFDSQFSTTEDAACEAFGGASEEVRINKQTVDYLQANDLWYVEGKAARFASGQVVNFPPDAREVKANWIKLEDAEKALGHTVDKEDYHWDKDDAGNIWLLVAMHLVSKETPNWIWATFEHEDNPCWNKHLKAQDTFGLKDGQVTQDLLALFDKYKLDREPWANYRLDGAQVNFTDPTGRPIILGNSITEFGFQTTASCMTCHSRSTTDRTGSKFLPVFDYVGQSDNGVPNPDWFYYNSFSPEKPIFMPLDFLWSVSFCPNQIGSKQAHCSLPSLDRGE